MWTPGLSTYNTKAQREIWLKPFYSAICKASGSSLKIEIHVHASLYRWHHPPGVPPIALRDHHQSILVFRIDPDECFRNMRAWVYSQLHSATTACSRSYRCATPPLVACRLSRHWRRSRVQPRRRLTPVMLRWFPNRRLHHHHHRSWVWGLEPSSHQRMMVRRQEQLDLLEVWQIEIAHHATFYRQSSSSDLKPGYLPPP